MKSKLVAFLDAYRAIAAEDRVLAEVVAGHFMCAEHLDPTWTLDDVNQIAADIMSEREGMLDRNRDSKPIAITRTSGPRGAA